ncbi:hypothetical protein [Rothia nasimurium]|uniref:hypothetical protein n=1 Tax=Rothia nasimurium TaxID=85336 RepID=UPI0014320AA6|nr:hypothetical protein [Rothia nasimurium]MBF0808127.1 hypothetical protein [Rothia nasimurium]
MLSSFAWPCSTRLYAQTQTVVPSFAGLALALVLAVKVINLTVAGVLGEASVLFAPCWW